MVAAVPVGDTNDRLIVIGVTVCIRPVGVQREGEYPYQNSPPLEGWQAQPDGVVLLTDIPPGHYPVNARCQFSRTCTQLQGFQSATILQDVEKNHKKGDNPTLGSGVIPD
jgi:hypothetical protein